MNQHFRQQWREAGLKWDAGSAAVVPPPPPGFLRVYHLTSAEFAISNIGLGRIKVARFSDLNDPFELLAANFRERRTQKAVIDFKNAYNQHTGLLCFSADWKSPVLWSHYAAKHAGICLGFNLAKQRAQSVHYEDERLLAGLDESGDPTGIAQPLQDLLLCTKYRHWQYEEEVRVFVPLETAKNEGKLFFCPFDSDLQLAEIILGPRCDLSLDTVRKLASATQAAAVVFGARLAYKFFAVVPKEDTVPRLLSASWRKEP